MRFRKPRLCMLPQSYRRRSAGGLQGTSQSWRGVEDDCICWTLLRSVRASCGGYNNRSIIPGVG